MRVRILLAALAIAALAAGFKFMSVREDLRLQRGKIDEGWVRVRTAMDNRAAAVPHMLDLIRQGESDSKELDLHRKSLVTMHRPEEKIRANRELSLALAKVLLRCETDPVVRASGGFRRVREELATHEDEIANARFQYNSALEHYNARIQRFPDNVVASLAGFSRDDAYFGTGPETALAPKTPN